MQWAIKIGGTIVASHQLIIIMKLTFQSRLIASTGSILASRCIIAYEGNITGICYHTPCWSNTETRSTHYWFRGYPLGSSDLGRWFKSGVWHLQCLQTVSYLWDEGLDRPRAAPVIGLRASVCPQSLFFMDIPKTSPAGVRGSKVAEQI